MQNDKFTRSVRLIKLMDILAKKTPSGGATLEELVKACNVTPRQIYRDLTTLEEKIGTKVIRPQKGQHFSGRYRLDQDFSLKIGPETAAVLFLSVLRQKGGPLATKINDIKDTLIAALFKNRFASSKQSLDNLQSRIFIIEEELLNLNKAGEIINKLMQAITENKVISLTYFTPSRNEESKRDVSPYGLISKHNNWYLVGLCHKSNEIRTFRLDLINNVFVLGQTFEFPQDFCLDKFLGDSWGVYTGDEVQEVLIKVSSQIAYRFKNFAYHPSQRIQEELPDGAIIVAYSTSGLNEFTAWLMTLGDRVEILKPESLRQQMKVKLEKMLEKYK